MYTTIRRLLAFVSERKLMPMFISLRRSLACLYMLSAN